MPPPLVSPMMPHSSIFKPWLDLPRKTAPADYPQFQDMGKAGQIYPGNDIFGDSEIWKICFARSTPQVKAQPNLQLSQYNSPAPGNAATNRAGNSLFLHDPTAFLTWASIERSNTTLKFLEHQAVLSGYKWSHVPVVLRLISSGGLFKHPR